MVVPGGATETPLSEKIDASRTSQGPVPDQKPTPRNITLWVPAGMGIQNEAKCSGAVALIVAWGTPGVQVAPPS